MTLTALAPRRPPLVSKKLRDGARNEACVVCGYDAPGEVVTAHLPGADYGLPAGMGEKCDDWGSAYLCSRPNGCHDYSESTEGRRDYKWRLTALVRTTRRRLEQGLIRVAM